MLTMTDTCTVLVDRSWMLSSSDEPLMLPCGHEKDDHMDIDGWYCRACYLERGIPGSSIERAYDATPAATDD